MASIVILVTAHRARAQEPSVTREVTFAHVNVVPMTSSVVLADQDVTVRGARIVRIARAGQVRSGGRVIDGTGKYLMPGLIDLHVHLFSAADLPEYAAQGVTTVLDMSGTRMQLALRQDARKGQLLSPRLYVASPAIDGYPPLNEVFLTAETPAQGEGLVRQARADGYDIVKVYGTLRPDVFSAIQKTAVETGLKIVGHINRQVGALGVLKSGQVLAAHAEDLLFARFGALPSEAELAIFADAVASSGITVTPNLNVGPVSAAQMKDVAKVMAAPGTRGLSAAAYSQWIKPNNRNQTDHPDQELEQMAQIATVVSKFVGMLQERGVRLVLGTDASSYGLPGLSAHEELEELTAAGFSPYQALLTATANAGEFLSANIAGAPKLGVVVKGAEADLVLLEADPTVDVRATRRISGAMLNGRWRPANELARIRDEGRTRQAALKRFVDAVDSELEVGDVAKARVLARPLKSEQTPWIAEWVLMTKAHKWERKDGAIAEAIARWSVELFANNHSAHHTLARILFQQGNLDGAQAETRKALALQPYDASSQALAEEIASLQVPPSFAPAGEYLLDYANDQTGELRSVRLLIQRGLSGSWKGQKVDSDGTSETFSEVRAGSDRLWMIVPAGYGNLELRLKVSGGQVTGYWAGMFGANGKVNGRKLK